MGLILTKQRLHFLKKGLLLYPMLGILNGFLLGYWQYKARHTKSEQKRWIYNEKKHKIILSYIDKNLSKYRKDTVDLYTKELHDYPIWFFWWQGEEDMPDVVRVCYRVILENSNGHKVIFLSKENFSNYADISYIILNKIGKGLTITQFSDIYRLSLLSKYGGLWLDATVFVSAPINNEIWQSQLFTIKNNPNDNKCVGRYRWAVNCIFVPQNTLFIQNIRRMFYGYWENNSTALDYLFIDYLFEYELQSNPEFQRILNALPLNNLHYHYIRENFNNQYTDTDYQRNMSDTYFSKLTYKGELIENTFSGNLTYYGFILNTLKKQ